MIVTNVDTYRQEHHDCDNADEARKCVAAQVKNKRHADQDQALGIQSQPTGP